MGNYEVLAFLVDVIIFIVIHILIIRKKPYTFIVVIKILSTYAIVMTLIKAILTNSAKDFFGFFIYYLGYGFPILIICALITYGIRKSDPVKPIVAEKPANNDENNN